MAERPRIVGIDLGTTNTCAAFVRNRLPKLVPTDRGNLVLPSVVGLSQKGDVLVGAVAKDQLLVQPKETIYGAKRLLGRAFDSDPVQQLRSYFTYEIVAGEDGEAAVLFGGKVTPLVEIAAHVLRHVKTIAENFLGGDVPEAVISVPAYYGDAQRAAVRRAGELAGFRVRRLVNEPTAAAMAYGFNRGLDQRILVYDLGGGTFDVSVLELNGNVFEVVATGGDPFLGGVDFDHRVAEFVHDEFQRVEKIDLRASSAIVQQRLRKAAEAAKIDLSLVPHAVVELPFIEQRRGKPIDLRVALGRERLEELTADLVARTFAICDRVLQEKGLTPRDIDEVILVGGQSRMPAVQAAIARHFGKPPRKGVHPDECVALGAALLADSLDSIDAATLIDALSQPIGLGSPTGHVRELIARNTKFPHVRAFRLPPPKEGAQEIELDVYQGEGDRVEQQEFRGRVRLPAVLAGRRIEFRLTEEGLLEVLADVPGQGLLKQSLDLHETPEALKQARAEQAAVRLAHTPGPAAEQPSRGLFGQLRKVFGKG